MKLERCNWTSLPPTKLDHGDAFNIPKVGDTLRVSMDNASGCLTKHVVVLTAHFDARYLDALRISCGGCSCLSSVHSPRNSCGVCFALRIDDSSFAA